MKSETDRQKLLNGAEFSVVLSRLQDLQVGRIPDNQWKPRRSKPGNRGEPEVESNL